MARRASASSNTVTGADLVPVVILGIDPEDRDARNLMVARDLSRELERRQRLEQGEHRTAEQSGLLTGDDGDGLRIRELPRLRPRARRRAAAALLIRDDRGDLGAPAAVRLRRRIASAQAAGSVGLPEKNGETAGKSKA